MVQSLWKTVRPLLKKLSRHLPYDAGIPGTGIYPREVKVSTQNVYMDGDSIVCSPAETTEMPSTSKCQNKTFIHIPHQLKGMNYGFTEQY